MSPESRDERIAKMVFAKIYPLYIDKVEKKGKTVEELHQVITWLTGFTDEDIQRCVKREISFAEFFDQATLNPNAHLIKGVVCGHRVEETENELTRKVRYLDKLIDELTRGKKMENILRG
ncbi:MAG: DUF2200 domain-containing protein [Planctomycetota bacterium]|jgi:hypothetical protein|nr:DUF2200 domain-containing protein [Planctomycetota bacterium]